MKEAEIKGSVFIFFVKAIRQIKDERIYQFLTEEDRVLVSGRIFPSGWYPLDTFWRIVSAIYKIYGEENPSIAREWGKTLGYQMLKNIYREQMTSSRLENPASSLKYLCTISKTFFSHAFLTPVSIEPGKTILRITKPSKNPASKIFYLILSGAFEKLVEVTGGKKPSVDISETLIKNEKSVDFIIRWQ